jgi:hypothetical protein
LREEARWSSRETPSELDASCSLCGISLFFGNTQNCVRGFVWQNAWKCFEAPGVGPVFPTKDDALGYAPTRVPFRTGKIRVLDLTGNVERVIEFNEADRRL